MAEDGDLMKAWKRGLNELAAANEGKYAMGAPPIVEAPAAEAPAAESPAAPEQPASYSEMIDRAAVRAESRQIEPQGMTR